MMKRHVALAFALTCSTALLAASPQPQRQKSPSLAERFPAPPGYSVEQDTMSEGTRDFSIATGVRGRILRRFVQAGDDGPAGVAEIVRYFADLLRAQGGVLFDDRLNSRAGRLDGRIPGARPVWLHVDINDESSVLDIIALEETAPSERQMPVDETRIGGSWTTGEAFVAMPEADRAMAMRTRDALSALAAPFFRPFQGWAWRVTVEELRDGSTSSASTYPYRVRVSGRQRSQACATCPVTTDTQDVTMFTITRADPARSAPPFAVIDVPWKSGVGEVSLYQHDLVEAFLRSAALADLVK